MRNLLTLVVILQLSNVVIAQNEACKAELTVENSISLKKASIIGTSYRLSLVNQGEESTDFFITVKNSAFSKYDNNVIMRFKFHEYKTSNSVKHGFIKKSDTTYQVTLSRNGRFDFIVELLCPKRAKVENKNITEVNVTSDKCSNISITKLLYTEIIESNIRQY